MAPISTLSAVFPPRPRFTDKNLPSLSEKVYIVTGAASGVGFELAKMLYVAGGTVYIAARSAERCEGAVTKIMSQAHGRDEGKHGTLKSMVIDLADLATVKPAVEGFLKVENRLDVLVHNAAVMTPPVGSKDKLGHDLEIGTNCLAPYAMTSLLEPILIRTTITSTAPSLSVRVVWVVSLLHAATLVQGETSPWPMGFDKNGTPLILKGMDNYMQSKVGATWLADEFSKRLGNKGILSVSVYPGLMKTELQRNWSILARLAMSAVFKSPVYGAYAELYAGFSPELKEEHNGGHVMAWGRIAELPKDIIQGAKNKSEGGTGAKERFLRYCNREVKDFL